MTDSMLNDDLPLVSVIIPAYNAEGVIEETLNSVLKQTYHQLEIIVVDDGSCDRTAEIVAAIAQRDRRVVLLRQANAGVAAARNLGIQQAKGEFIAPLDADDLWYPENIKKQVKCILASDKVGLVYSWSMDIDGQSQPIGNLRASRIEGEVYTTLLLHDFIANASSVLIRKTCFDVVGGYDSSLRQQQGQGGEDWDLYLRIAEHYEFRVVPEFLVGYRKLPGSMSTDSGQMARSRYLIWQKIRHRYPRIPVAIERLSNSSFYIHLACQNYQYTKYKIALNWLIKAIRSDPITPFLRPSFYSIAVQIGLSLLAQKLQLPIGSNLEARCIVRNSNSIQRPSSFPKAWSKKQLKVLGELLIHWIAPPLFGTAKSWL